MTDAENSYESENVGGGDDYGSVPFIDARAFQQVSAESIDSVLDLTTWSPDPDLSGLLDRVESEVAEAVRNETDAAGAIRQIAFPRIADRTRHDAAPECGVYSAAPWDLKLLWRQVLFNGGVEVCDGTRKMVSTLPLTITQLGVCLACYQGDTQSFAHRVFQRDLRGILGDPVEQVVALLDARAGSDIGAGEASRDRRLSTLLLRGVMTLMERKVLTDVSDRPWRMGHGHPVPFDLLTGSGVVDGAEMPLLRQGFETMTRLIEGHRRFVFVPSQIADHRIITLGNALRPCEYAIISTAQEGMSKVVKKGKYNPSARLVAEEFAKLGSQIAVGVYRASEFAPAQVFYSHIDHSHEAALIALADSLLQEHRGFPLLIDLADRLCQSAFGNDILDGALQSAFARANAPFRYLGERSTRS